MPLPYKLFSAGFLLEKRIGVYTVLEADRRAGLWVEAPVPEGAYDLAVELAKRYAARQGCRSLDTLHVASALELGARQFWTFDQRQRKLAKASGLVTT